MIPFKTLSMKSVKSNIIPPADIPFTTQALGGKGIGDVSLGNAMRIWSSRYENGKIYIYSEESEEGVEDYLLLDGVNNPKFLSICFDQSMMPFASFIEEGKCKFYWYDSSKEEYVLDTYDRATSIKCFFDETRINQRIVADVILLYIRDGYLYFRAQRDRFTIETPLTKTDGDMVRRCGMMTNKRVFIEVTNINFIMEEC